MAAERLDDDAAAMVARRDEIARAAIRIIDRDGMRGLSHRAVDRELGLAMGTTSYYARTDRQLVQVVVRRLSQLTATDVERMPAAPTTLDGATTRLVTGVEAVAARHSDARARFALSVELVNDPELHAYITHDSPIRELLIASAEQILAGLGIRDSHAHAPDLVALLNGIVFDWLAGPGVEENHRARAKVIVRAYLKGLGAPED